MRRVVLGCLVALVVGVLGAACEDEDPKVKADDEAYLKVVCSGLNSFSDAVNTKTKAEELAQVVRDFAVEMNKVEPPADVKEFHDQFVKYLDDAVSDPTSLLTREPPLPSKDVRQRLASKQSSVPECKSPTFFEKDQ